jgi:DUF1365 family protein
VSVLRANRGRAPADQDRASCLYLGTLAHHRFEPDRAFRHQLAMTYVDIDELPDLLDGRLLRRSAGLMRFRRSDYHGDPGVALTVAVRDTVECETGIRPAGPIRLLTSLRSLGLCFNPVSFYYCFDAAGQQLQAVLAEVTNTPWGERQAYAIAGEAGRFQKLMHVSPFMPIEQTYTLRTGVPAEHVAVTIESHREGRREFAASLQMRRADLTPVAVRRIAARYPLATVRTLALIYGHALALRVAGVRTYSHPRGGGV